MNALQEAAVWAWEAQENIVLAARTKKEEDPSFFYAMVGDVFAGWVTDADSFTLKGWEPPEKGWVEVTR